MNDNEVLDHIRNGLSEVRMGTPVEAIMARGRSRRRRRWGVAVTVTTGFMVGLVAISLLASVRAPTGENPARLPAFTLVSNLDGTATLTLVKGQIPDPDVLRAKLEQAGIPAVVNVGSSCDSAPEPVGLDEVVSSYQRADGSVVLVITPSAMPTGTELSIGFFPQGHTWALVTADAPLTCASTNPWSKT